MQFVHQALTWGFLLALLPLLIHLINMMRHRRIKWAAMEFLLESYKKHRKWVWLKQLILLLLRMLAVAMVVAMVAQWISRGQWLDLLGGTTTHHYILLDDSASMSDRVGGTTAFETALRTIQQIGSRAGEQQDLQQKITLIRFSQAERAALASQPGKSGASEQVADLNAERIDGNFAVQFEQARNKFDVSELSLSPRPSLDFLKQLLAERADEHNIVYVVSDFRAKEWDNPAELREAIRGVEQTRAEVHLVRCVKEQHGNLAIVDLKPSAETRAAGVPLFVDFQIKNLGKEPAEKVQVKLRSTFFDPHHVQSSSPDKLKGESAELPTVLIDLIGPGETVSRRVQVFFPEPGRHVVEASLPEDAVAADNRRFCVVEFPDAERVLVIDGHPSQRNAYFLSAAFQPGQRANTGVRADVQTATFLRDASAEILKPYSAIYLLDVQRLDDRAVELLESYVRGGGGLGLFLGERINFGFYNEKMYHEGNGLLPLPLGVGAELLPVSALEKTPDVDVTNHPIFETFFGERNPLIREVTVQRYIKPQPKWRPDPNSTVNVIARLHNQMPLAVEQKFGAGRVVVFLTTLAPDWNNWGHDPSFVVVVLKLQSYLASQRRADDPRRVGAPLDLDLPGDRFRKDISFVTPGKSLSDRVVIERAAAKVADDSPVVTASLGRVPPGETPSKIGETDRGGVYEAWLVDIEGKPEVRRWAVNVDPTEGDLSLVPSQQLLTKLEPAHPKWSEWDAWAFEQTVQAGMNRSLLVMVFLLILLLIEQVLAFSASYHPNRI